MGTDNRSVGDKFEQEVEKKLDIPRTTKSGGHWNNADLANRKIVIECKCRPNFPRFRPDFDEIEKVRKQANDTGREWAYIQKTKQGSFVTIDLELFVALAQIYGLNDDVI